MKTNQKGVALWAQRSGYRIDITPPVMNPSPYLLLRQSGDLSPLSQWSCRAVALNHAGVALVSRLFAWACPSTVLRKVAFVIVNAINGVGRSWRYTHVSKEGVKAVAPSVAHSYASSAVVHEVGVGGLMAAPNHERPSVVFLGGSTTIRVTALPVLQVLDTGHFPVQAPARLGVTASQFVGANDACRSAGAIAIPSHGKNTAAGMLNVLAPADNKQATECLTGKINKSWHFFTLKWLTVMGAWQAAVNSFSGATLAKRVAF